MTASVAAVDSRPWCSGSWLGKFVECVIVGLFNKRCVLIQSHFDGSLSGEGEPYITKIKNEEKNQYASESRLKKILNFSKRGNIE
jgi:hypothetical protein